MFQIGLDAKLYRNTGTYAVPVWVEVKNVKDVTLNLERSEVDVTTRASDWKQYLAALKDASLEFELQYDHADADYTALRDGFLNGTALEFAVMDGDITTSGSEGLRASFAVTGFSRNEPLEDGVTMSVTMKPTQAANAPEWMTVV